LNNHFTPTLRKDVFKTRLPKKDFYYTKQVIAEIVDENEEKYFRDGFNLVY